MSVAVAALRRVAVRNRNARSLNSAVFSLRRFGGAATWKPTGIAGLRRCGVFSPKGERRISATPFPRQGPQDRKTCLCAGPTDQALFLPARYALDKYFE